MRARDGVFFVLGVRDGRVLSAPDDAAHVARLVMIVVAFTHARNVAVVENVGYCRVILRFSCDTSGVRGRYFYSRESAFQCGAIKIVFVFYSRVI